MCFVSPMHAASCVCFNIVDSVEAPHYVVLPHPSLLVRTKCTCTF